MRTVTHEPELNAPVDLCLPDGRLNPAAVGWTRRPLHTANLRGWGRNKRWEYWGIVTADHIVNVAAGGTHDDDNLAAICEPCHTVKSERERVAGQRRAGKRRAVSRKRQPEAHPGMRISPSA